VDIILLQALLPQKGFSLTLPGSNPSPPQLAGLEWPAIFPKNSYNVFGYY